MLDRSISILEHIIRTKDYILLEMLLTELKSQNNQIKSINVY